MSKSRTPEQGDQPHQADDYVVGYGRPPVESRFQPGRSGNPKGRPKRNKPQDRARFGDMWLDEFLLDEAYREVAFKENGRTIRLPAIQVALRSVMLQASKGSRLHMKMWVDLVGAVEQQHNDTKFALFRQVLDGKLSWKQQCEEAAAKGLPLPKPPIPHPDDVHINPFTAEVEFRGPMTEEQKKALDDVISHRDSLQAILDGFAAQEEECGPLSAEVEYSLARYRRLVDRANEAIPERYRSNGTRQP